LQWLILTFALLIPSYVYAECSFKTSDHLAEMTSPTKIKSIDIEIPKSSKFAQNQLKIIVSRSTNIPDRLKKSFNANIRINFDFGSCLYRGRVRQSGDLKDHIKLINGNVIQSLDVKLKNGNILNAVRFKLLIPQTRNGLNEVLATTILRSLGFIVPETFEVNTSINGIKTTMLFQERAEKELLERNLRREGPIFRGDEVLMFNYKNFELNELDRLSFSTLYNKGWFSKGSSSQQIILSAYKKLQTASLKARYHQVTEGGMSYLIPDNASEALYNDFMGVLIAMDGYHGLYQNNRRHYFNAISGKFEPIYYDGNVDLSFEWRPLKSNKIMPIMMSKHLFERIEKLGSNRKLQNEFFKRVINQNEADLFFSESLANFKNNIIKIQLQSGLIEDFNKSLSTVSDLEYYSWYKDMQETKQLKQKLITDIKIAGNSYVATFDDQSLLALSDDEVLNIISNNSLHDQRVVYMPLALTKTETIKDYYKNVLISGVKIRMSKGMSAKYNLTKKRLMFYQTDPSDWALIHDSYLNGWVITLKGLALDRARPIPEQRFNGKGLTGCLTVYNSELIDTSLLVTNGQCEDSLNLINTSGNKIRIRIHDSYADAIDADFSYLDIDFLDVLNASNDCFDVSGGEYFVRSSKLKDCGDKGISIGEKSYFKGDEISLENASIGISAKDSSRVVVKRINAKDVLICGESKRKKQEFGGGQLYIGETNCNGDYYIDNESIIRIGK